MLGKPAQPTQSKLRKISETRSSPKIKKTKPDSKSKIKEEKTKKKGEALKSWLQSPNAGSNVTVKLDRTRMSATMTNNLMINNHTVREPLPGEPGGQVEHVGDAVHAVSAMRLGIVPGEHVGSEGVAVHDVSMMREIVPDGHSEHEGDAVHDQKAPDGIDGQQGVGVHDVDL